MKCLMLSSLLTLFLLDVNFVYSDGVKGSNFPALTYPKSVISMSTSTSSPPIKYLTTDSSDLYATEAYVSQDYDYQEYVQPKNKEDDFDWKLSREIFKQSKKDNLIVSPLSVKILLTVLAEAAGQDVPSQTRRELKKVLPFRHTLNDTREYYQRVLASLNTPHPGYNIKIASKSFVRKDIKFSQKVSSNLEHFYGIKLESLDFKDSFDSVKKINDWVTQTTNGKIIDLVDAESISSSVMLLINALYFRGLWSSPFDQTLTKEFFVEPEVKVEKEFVKQVHDFLYCYSTELKARFLRLPYEGNRFSMFLILPFENDGLHEVIEQLDAEKIRKTVEKMEELSVKVVLPKFKFDSSLKLNSVIKKLGIKSIFTDNATFPLLFSRNSGASIKVSNIIQKSGIIVDEKGSEAHAATEIELIDKFGGNPRDFIADHPFLFYIEDDTTGAKVFSGIVNNPVY